MRRLNIDVIGAYRENDESIFRKLFHFHFREFK